MPISRSVEAIFTREFSVSIRKLWRIGSVVRGERADWMIWTPCRSFSLLKCSFMFNTYQDCNSLVLWITRLLRLAFQPEPCGLAFLLIPTVHTERSYPR